MRNTELADHRKACPTCSCAAMAIMCETYAELCKREQKRAARRVVERARRQALRDLGLVHTKYGWE